jgi:beta-mannanase
VSALLVPSCGAWFGASTASLDGTFNYTTGMTEYENVAQDTPDIIHFYKRNATTFPTAAEIAQSERPGKQRSLLFYNWKPASGLTWKQIADGGADAAIVTVANGLKQYHHKLFLTIWHEPENDGLAAGSGMTPEDYVAMYRHVVLGLRAQGVTNAVFVVNYMGFSNWSTVVDGYYPGNDVVDWIAYDPYGGVNQTDIGKVLNSKSGTWPGFYSWATAKAPGKPIMLGEWGIDLAKQPAAASIIDGATAIIQSQFPMLKAFVYWNDDANNFKVRLDQAGALGTAYGQAYQRMADQAYFAATQTALAP